MSSYIRADGGDKFEVEAAELTGGGVAMGTDNFGDSIRVFARPAKRHPLDRHFPLTLSTKNTIAKARDGQFKAPSGEVFESEFKDEFEAWALPKHRLIDDMVAQALKPKSGIARACKNYDRDVESDVVAQRFGSLGPMTSLLMTPDGHTVEADAARGTVTLLGGNPGLTACAPTLEDGCTETLQHGEMTKDLAALAGHGTPYLSTERLLEATAYGPKKKLEAKMTPAHGIHLTGCSCHRRRVSSDPGIAAFRWYRNRRIDRRRPR